MHGMKKTENLNALTVAMSKNNVKDADTMKVLTFTKRNAISTVKGEKDVTRRIWKTGRQRVRESDLLLAKVDRYKKYGFAVLTAVSVTVDPLMNIDRGEIAREGYPCTGGHAGDILENRCTCVSAFIDVLFKLNSHKMGKCPMAHALSLWDKGTTLDGGYTLYRIEYKMITDWPMVDGELPQVASETAEKFAEE